MKNKIRKPELLAPAGDIDTLKSVILYGADAVYVGGKIGSLRASAFGFSIAELKKASEICRKNKKKLYLALNILAHNNDLKILKNYLLKIKKIPFDAFIVSDIGVIHIIKEVFKGEKNKPEIHLSTQANITNVNSAKEILRLGTKRIVLARELTFDEIKQFSEIKNLDIEIFVHGAMCISYSGRCLLSNYMTGRESNKGECAQSCRWEYRVADNVEVSANNNSHIKNKKNNLCKKKNQGDNKQNVQKNSNKNNDNQQVKKKNEVNKEYLLFEEKRAGEEFLISEDERGTYIFNSKDLCLIEEIPKILSAEICSLKIEGRMKSSYYALSVVRAYRYMIDETYDVLSKQIRVIDKSEVKSANRTTKKSSEERKSILDEKRHKLFNQILKDKKIKKLLDKKASVALTELYKTSYRDYTKAFFNGRKNEETINYKTRTYIRNYDFIARVIKLTNKNIYKLNLDEDNFTENDLAKKNKNTSLFANKNNLHVQGKNSSFFLIEIEQRNYFRVGDEVEIFGGDISFLKTKVIKIYEIDNNKKLLERDVANHPLEKLLIEIDVKNAELINSFSDADNKNTVTNFLSIIKKDFIIRKSV